MPDINNLSLSGYYNISGSLNPVFVIAGNGTGLTASYDSVTKVLQYSLVSPVSTSLGGTGVTSLTNHGILLGSGSGAIRSLSVGATNTVLLGNTGIDPSFGQVPNAALANSSVSLTNGNNISFGSISVSLGGSISANVTGTTNHAIQLGNASGSLSSLSIGATGTVLLGNTGADPSFGAVPNSALANSSVTLTNGTNITFGAGSVSLGGSMTASISGTTNRAVQVGNSGGSLTSLAVGTNGQLLIGATGSNPVFSSPTSSDSSITYTAGSGTLSMAVTQATTSQLGGGTFATTAEVLTGTSTTKFPSVASMIGHEGVVKGWVKFNTAGTIQDSYNVSSVSKGGTGVFTVNWATQFANANYCIQVSALTSGPITQNVTAQSASACTVQYTGGSVTLLGILVILAGAVDPTMGYVLAIGDR